jgi:PhoPQ-activated pathogenicity-related protein
MRKAEYPLCKWQTSQSKNGVQITVEASKNILSDVKIWYADSDDKDFRNEIWLSKDLHISHQSKIQVTEKFPAKGFRAFYVDLTYKDANGGTYTISTRAFMVDKSKIL